MRERSFAGCVLLALVACGSHPDVSSKDNGVLGNDGGAGSGAVTASGGSASNQGSGGLVLGGGTTGNSGGSVEGPSGGVTSVVNVACATDNGEARRTPLDIALLVDTSYSMDFDFKWQQVSGALLTFASAPRFNDIGVALQFFPARAQCSISAYGHPVVPLGELPAAEPQLRQAVQNQRMFGGTPLVQVLQGMGSYIRDWAGAHTDHKAVMVLATDGIPDDICTSSNFSPPNGLDAAASIAKGLADDDRVPVFVIGVGKELGALDAIAASGGTDQAILVDVGGDVQRQFLEALDGIRRRAVACDFEIPEPKSGQIDYAAVNVEFTRTGKMPELFYYVASADKCDTAATAAWYYDDPQQPTKVVLCPETCGRVTNTDGSRIDVVFGCKRAEVIK